ncbi:hypothetical protein WMY93_028556 [Mugilogobius chulae]|uniref:LIM zinc-binding domain-containing protein n=1 Tax=Mugilogobius chulae TaxID=88201 RepID=A0AAW0MNL6_9GOBI
MLVPDSSFYRLQITLVTEVDSSKSLSAPCPEPSLKVKIQNEQFHLQYLHQPYWIKKAEEEDEAVDRDPNFGRSVLSRYKVTETVESSEPSKTTTTRTSTSSDELNTGSSSPTRTSYSRNTYTSVTSPIRTSVTEEPKTSTTTTTVTENGKTTETTVTTTTQKSSTKTDTFMDRVFSDRTKGSLYTSYSPTKKTTITETTTTSSSSNDAEDKLYDTLLPDAIKNTSDSKTTVSKTETVIVKSSDDTAEDKLYDTLIPSTIKDESKIFSTETVTIKSSNEPDEVKTTTTTRTSTSSTAEDQLYDILIPKAISNPSTPTNSSITKKDVYTVSSSGGDSPTFSSTTRTSSYSSYTDSYSPSRTSTYTISTKTSDDIRADTKAYSYTKPDSSYEFTRSTSPSSYSSTTYKTTRNDDILSDSYSRSSPINTYSSERTVLEKDLCSYCRKPFTGDAKIILDDMKINCHASCFKCEVCNSTLGHLKAGDSMWIYKHMVHCERCFEVTRGSGVMGVKRTVLTNRIELYRHLSSISGSARTTVVSNEETWPCFLSAPQCAFYQMEGEVVSPQIMADVNGNNKMTNAELEVIKLQELVRKLEKQNEQLRTRANAVNHCTVGPPLPLQTTALSCLRGGTACPGDTLFTNVDISCPTKTDLCTATRQDSSDEPFAYFQPSSTTSDAAEDDNAASQPTTVLDEIEILDLGFVLPTEEPDRWLYVSPKVSLNGDSALSPLQWCRQVLDHPGPEVQLARMTLCNRLDQAKRWRGVSSVRPYSCIEGISTLSCPVLPYSKSSALFEPTAPLPSSQSFLVPTPRTNSSLSDRAPTFLSNSTLHNLSRRHAKLSPQSSLDSEVGVSELEDDSISMSYKLQDMTDVEVMARLQEESLRQDYASTSSTSRRSSTFSIHSLRRSEIDLEEEDEDEEGYDQLPPPQPRLFRTGSMQRAGLPHSHTFSSIRDCSRNTSQFSLSGLAQFSGPSNLIRESPTLSSNSTDKLRRSMPNLIRAPSMPSVPSIPSLSTFANPAHGPSSLPSMPTLRNSQSFDSSSGLARLQSSIPPPGQLSHRVQSVGNFPSMPRHPLKATAYVSPTIQQSPTSTSLTTSTSLNSISSSPALPQPLKPSSSLVPLSLKTSSNHLPRSSLPRPASFLGTSLRTSKISQPTRSLLTPPKSIAALSALRDGSWKDGCY